MSNEYGYLKRDSLGLSSDQFTFSTNSELQSDGDSSVIGSIYASVQLASFEKDRYKLGSSFSYRYEFAEETPKGFISSAQSDSIGNFSNFHVRAETKEGVYVSQNGFTITSANFIEEIVVFTYRDNVEIGEYTLTDADSVKKDLGYQKKQAFFVELEKINRIEFFVRKIDKPYNFFYLFDFSISIEEDIGDDVLISSESVNKFSVYGEVLEYSSLDFEVFESGHNRVFRKNEEIKAYDQDGQATTFFAYQSVDTGRGDMVNCADVVSLLEGQFTGRLYDDVISTVAIEQCVGEGLSQYFNYDLPLYNCKVNGYLPVCTQREALQQILLGTNARLFKDDSVEFLKKFSTDNLETFIYDETNILENPEITRNEPLKKVIVRQHNFSQNEEIFEIYNHTAVKGSRVFLNEPIWDVRGFFSYDEGKTYEALSYEALKLLIEPHINYIVFLKDVTDALLKLEAKGYTDSVVEYVKENTQTVENEEYLTKTVDLYVYDDAQAVCDLLYELYSRPYSIVFRTLHKPKLGGLYEILGHKLNICAIRDTMNGVYEVEAR